MISFCGNRIPSRCSASRQGLRRVQQAGPCTAHPRTALKGNYPQKGILSCRPIFNLTIGRICPSPSVLQIDQLQTAKQSPCPGDCGRRPWLDFSSRDRRRDSSTHHYGPLHGTRRPQFDDQECEWKPGDNLLLSCLWLQSKELTVN